MLIAIFVLLFWINLQANGQYYYGYYGDYDYGGDNDGPPPNGYHYETMDEVLRNYQLGTYMIVPLSSSPLGTAGGSGTTSGSGTAGGGGGNAASGGANAAGDTAGNNAGQEQTSDGATAEQGADAAATARKRRGFFDFSFPSFMSSNVNETTTKSTSVVNGGDVTTTTTGTTTDVETKACSDVGEKTAVNTTTSSTTTVNTTTAAGAGFMSYYNAATVSIVGIGKELGSSMVVAAPYLPIVYKVAIFIVPGLSSYQALLLAVNVATITTEAVRNYEGGQSFSQVASDAGYQALKTSMVGNSSMFVHSIGAIGGGEVVVRSDLLKTSHSPLSKKCDETVLK